MLKPLDAGITCLLGLFCLLNNPVYGYTLKVGSEHFLVKIPETSEAYERGLMGCKHLAAHEGMLFLFAPSQPQVGFWMKNCLIPLDMVFIYQGKISEILPNRPPCPAGVDNCPVYTNQQGLVDAVLEVAAGTSEKYFWKPGIRVSLFPKHDESLVLRLLHHWSR